MGGYLIEGKLLWQRDAPDRLKKALDSWRQQLDADFEDALAAELAASGMAVRKRLTEPRARRAGLAHLPGEIDVVAADIAHQRIWLFEAKRLSRGFQPADWLHDLIEFRDDVGLLSRAPSGSSQRTRQVEKLLTKAHYVSSHLRQILDMLSLHGAEENWTTIPVIVTAAPHPAAFVIDPLVTITVLDYVSPLVQSEQMPRPGWFEPPAPSGGSRVTDS